MYALSLLQPWASLVMMGVKTVETRSWSTAYRGSLMIHASKGKAGSLFASEPPFKKYIPDFNKLPFGCILGKVTLEQIYPMEAFDMADESINRLTLEEKAFGDYSSGRYAWVLTEPQVFLEPVPARGMPGLWQPVITGLSHR